MKTILQIESLTAEQLFEKIESLKTAQPVDELEVLSQYWQEFNRKDAANIIGCSPSTLDKICREFPEKLRPNANGKYPIDRVFEVKRIGWKNLR